MRHTIGIVSLVLTAAVMMTGCEYYTNPVGPEAQPVVTEEVISQEISPEMKALEDQIQALQDEIAELNEKLDGYKKEDVKEGQITEDGKDGQTTEDGYQLDPGMYDTEPEELNPDMYNPSE